MFELLLKEKVQIENIIGSGIIRPGLLGLQHWRIFIHPQTF
jgi:hypothetical protein